jgi:hypothetical protein
MAGPCRSAACVRAADDSRAAAESVGEGMCVCVCVCVEQAKTKQGIQQYTSYYEQQGKHYCRHTLNLDKLGHKMLKIYLHAML